MSACYCVKELVADPLLSFPVPLVADPLLSFPVPQVLVKLH